MLIFIAFSTTFDRELSCKVLFLCCILAGYAASGCLFMLDPVRDTVSARLLELGQQAMAGLLGEYGQVIDRRRIGGDDFENLPLRHLRQGFFRTQNRHRATQAVQLLGAYDLRVNVRQLCCVDAVHSHQP